MSNPPAARAVRRGSRRWKRMAAMAREAMGQAQEMLSPERRDDFGHAPGRPILLLHGFAAPRRILAVLERRLRRHLGVSVISFHLEGLGGAVGGEPTADEANRLGDKLERLCLRHGVTELDLVGHSRGGLLARHMVTHHPVGRRVRTLMTLGTPFAGAPLAVVGAATLGLISRAVRDLVPFSRFMRGLRTAPLPAHVRAVSISGGMDLVAPPWLCRLSPGVGAPGQVHNRVVPGITHNGLLMSQRVFGVIKEELLLGRGAGLAHPHPHHHGHG